MTIVSVKMRAATHRAVNLVCRDVRTGSWNGRELKVIVSQIIRPYSSTLVTLMLMRFQRNASSDQPNPVQRGLRRTFRLPHNVINAFIFTIVVDESVVHRFVTRVG